MPYHQSAYGWIDYDAHMQNWDLAQDARGVLYVANTSGVLEWDGEEWRRMTLPRSGRAGVRSLIVSESGEHYVGGSGELGMLRPNTTGELQFTSFLDHLPDSLRAFSDVWNIFDVGDEVIFHAQRQIMRWDGHRMEVTLAETRFHTAFEVEGRVFVREPGIGLRELRGGRLDDIDGGSFFAGRKIFALLPHSQGLMAAVPEEGLHLLSNGTVRVLQGGASRYLQQYQPYAGAVLPGAYGRARLYAVATLGGGVIVFDEDGNLIRVYREDVGLNTDDYVVGLAFDRQGGLWLALLDGLRRFDVYPQYTSFGPEQGVRGSPYNIKRHRGKIYVATSNGLFRLQPGTLGRGEPAYSSFERVAEIPETQVWYTREVDGSFLVGTNYGLYVLGQGRVIDGYVFSIQPDRKGGMAFVGTKSGVLVVEKDESGEWIQSRRFEEIEGEVRSMAFTYGTRWKGSALWVVQQGGSVYRIQNPESSASRVIRYGVDQGLPEGGGNSVIFRGDEKLSVVSQFVTYRYNPSSDRFEAMEEGDEDAPSQREEESVFAGHGDRVWVHREGKLRLRTESGMSRPLLADTQVQTLLEEANGIVWIGTDDGIVRWDPRVDVVSTGFSALVRRVADMQHHTLYGGAAGWQASDAYGLTLPYAENSMRFEFAATDLRTPGTAQYRYRLDGYNTLWSPWSRDRYTNYTNLPPGRYTFRVQARNQFERISDEGTFTLRIFPPWYRTWWAYTLYVLAFLSIVWGVSAWRIRRLRRRQEADRRAAERLDRLNARLHETNARLRHADKLKDDLLANTSHELRTPLTAILGFSEILLEEATGEIRGLAESIYRGGRRLLETVNALLDMAKLQAGTLSLHPTRTDVREVAQSVVELLQPIAQQKGLYAKVWPDRLPVEAELDESALRRVLTNLVGNGLKFTSEGGVSILLDETDEEVRILVRDTGIGIDEEFLPLLFEPFEQASRGDARTYEGTGLGLAITRHLVRLMGGRIEVQSVSGEGTTFEVALPRTQDAGRILHPVEGAETSPASLVRAHVLALSPSRDTEAVVTDLLVDSGRVTVTTGLVQTLREARRTTYDVLLLDADHAGDGLRLLRAVRRIPGYRATPVIIVGAIEEQVRNAHVLAKPPQAYEMMELLETLLMDLKVARHDQTRDAKKASSRWASSVDRGAGDDDTSGTVSRKTSTNKVTEEVPRVDALEWDEAESAAVINEPPDDAVSV